MTKKMLLAAALALASGPMLSAQPRVIAHRGYWTAPGSAQNSLDSFSKADSIGVYGSEMDVWLTADNHLIVNHDRVFHDTEVDMEKASFREITSLVLSNGEHIPSLDAYLALVRTKPTTRLILEMKALSLPEREKKAVAKIVRALEKFDLIDRTDIISFSLGACLEFRRLLPDTRIFYLSGDLSPREIGDRGLSGIDYPMSALRENPHWIDEAHRLGLEVNVWTVDSEEDMRDFIGRGVDYITTNYPERLQALLRN